MSTNTNQYPTVYVVADQTKLPNLMYVAQLIADGLDPDAHEVAAMLAALHARSLGEDDHSTTVKQMFERLRKGMATDPTNFVWSSSGEVVVFDEKRFAYVVLTQKDWTAWSQAKQDGGLQ